MYIVGYVGRVGEVLMVEVKTVVCASCDIGCQLHAEVTAGRVTKVKAHSNPILRDNICMKGIYAPKAFAHPTASVTR